MGLKGERLVAAAYVQPGHVKLNSWAHACRALRCGGAGRLASLKFQSQPVSEGVALGLLHLHQNIFLRIGSLRILHRRIHLAEDAEIVEPGLGVEQILLAERVSVMHLQFALHDVVAGVFGSRHHHAIHREAFPFLNRVGYVFTIGLVGRRLGRDFQRGVGKSVIEVITEDSFPIVRQILLGVRLAGLRA